MATPERAGGELAQTEQLQTLFKSTELCLALYGEYFIEPNTRHNGMIDGIPIHDDPVQITLRINGNRIRQRANWAAAVLCVGSELIVSEILPYYSKNIVDEHTYFDYTPHRCMFSIERADSDHITNETIFINGGDAERPWMTTRMIDTLGDIPMAPESSPEERVRALASGYNLEREVGLHRLTQDECQALHQVLDCVTG